MLSSEESPCVHCAVEKNSLVWSVMEYFMCSVGGEESSVCAVDKDPLVSPVEVKFPCLVGGGICTYPLSSWVKKSPVCAMGKEFPCVLGG